MAKNIVMRMDGEPQRIGGVKKINTALAGGSRADWLPDDETRLANLEVFTNGVYRASDFGYYGINRIDVMVAGGDGAQLEPPDDEEDQTVAYVKAPTSSAVGASLVEKDPETGVITYKVIKSDGTIESKTVPSYAMVTVPPKSEYQTLEDQMDYTCAEITLYYGDDTVAEDYGGGVLVEGTSAWDSYVRTTEGTVRDVMKSGLVVMYVLPWWYEGGTSFGIEYQIRAFYSITVGGAA